MIAGNMDLYTDNKPTTTLKGTGFKDEKTALNTIKLIKNRSIIYKKALINTLYNRAKYHPNITDDIMKAMKIFEKWLKINNKIRIKYPYLRIDIIKKFEKIAESRNISRVARGIDKPIKSDYGFLVMYKKIKNPAKLAFIPVKKTKPSGNDYDSMREKFLNARSKQIKGKNGLYNENGEPTTPHLVLIMNGYSPDKKLYTK